MLRTDESNVILKAMQTVREVGSDFKNVVMEVHGMFDQFAGSLYRIPGKLISSVCTTSSVWSITQLRFHDVNTIVQQVNGSLNVTSTFPDLPGLIFPDPVFEDPVRQPNPNPPDWPESDPINTPLVPGQPNPSRPPEGRGPSLLVPFTEHPVRLIVDPTSLTFDRSLSEQRKLLKLQLVDAATGGPPRIPERFWQGDVSWSQTNWLWFDSFFTVWDSGGMFPIAWLNGTINDMIQNCYVNVRWDQVPYGISHGTVAIRLIEWGGGGVSQVVGMGGAPLGVTVPITLINPGTLTANSPVTLQTTTVGVHGTWEDITLTNTSVGFTANWTATILSDTSGKLVVTPSSGSVVSGTPTTVVLSLSSIPVAGTYAAVVRFSAPGFSSVDVTVNITVAPVFSGIIPCRLVGEWWGAPYNGRMDLNGGANYYNGIHQFGPQIGILYFDSVLKEWHARFDPDYVVPVDQFVGVTFDPATGCPAGTASWQRGNPVETITSTFGIGVT